MTAASGRARSQLRWQRRGPAGHNAPSGRVETGGWGVVGIRSAIGRGVIGLAVVGSLGLGPFVTLAQDDAPTTCNGDVPIGAPIPVVDEPTPETEPTETPAAEQRASPAASPQATPVPVRYHIALVGANSADPVLAATAEGAAKAAAELDQTVEAFATASDATDPVADALAKHPDALIVDPTGIADAESRLRDAVAAGIKVVTVGGDVAPDARTLHVAPSDPDQLGRMAMQLVGDRLQCAGDVADFSSSEGDEPQKAWLAAFTDELALPGYGGMRSVYTVFDGGDPQLAYTRAMQIMVAYPSLVGVVAFTPETTEQVVRAVHDADRVADIFVVSVTGTPGLPNGVPPDGVDAVVSPNPEATGFLAYVAAFDLVTGKFAGTPGETLVSPTLGSFAVGDNGTILAGPPLVTMAAPAATPTP